MSQWLTSDVKPVYVEQFIPPRSTLMEYFISKVHADFFLHFLCLILCVKRYRGESLANHCVVVFRVWILNCDLNSKLPPVLSALNVLDLHKIVRNYLSINLLGIEFELNMHILNECFIVGNCIGTIV